MIRKHAITMSAVFLYTISFGHGQDFAQVGTAVAQFLEIGMGARGTGLGEAYTAMTNDAGSVFWNPAGLVDGGRVNLYTSYSQWPADISIGALSYSMGLGRIGTIAASIVYLMTDDMEITTVFSPNGTGQYFSISNYSLGLSYARYLTDRVSVGVTAKLVGEEYWDYGYSTWAVDMGTVYRTGFHGLRIGMSILHFGPEVKFSGSYIDYSDPLSVDIDNPKSFETYSLPINFRFGACIDILNTAQHTVTTSADMVHTNNNLEHYNWGAEYSLNRMFFLRSGYRITADEGGLSLGAGAKLNPMGQTGFAVDYSYSDMGILKNSHRFSLIFSF